MAKKKAKKALKDTFKIFKMTIGNFGTNRPAELAGTTAYFAMFSMIPIIIIIISVFGYLTGDESIRDKLFDELNVMLGTENAKLLQEGIENFKISEKSTIGTVIGVIFFFISATALFSSMQNAINYIWRIRIKSSFRMGLLNLLKTRFLSFGMIITLGFILLISLVVDASIAYLKDYISNKFDINIIFIAQTINLFLSLAIISTLFAFIYRVLPDVHVEWSAAWFGAIITSVLFTISKLIIGLVMGGSNIGGVYGAAGSIVVILVWIYFVSIILYFGVELSRQYSRYHQHANAPAKFAALFEIHQINYGD